MPLLRSAGVLILVLAAVNAATWGYRALRPAPDDPMADLPRTVLWLWERPEDLRFADPDRTAFAVLATTILVDPDGLTVRPRAQPALLPPGAKQVAVVRIETRPPGSVPLGAATVSAMLPPILELARRPGLSALQIDFDATASERGFYRDLLGELRSRLRPGVRLSITALASWCFDDGWIAGLPVDEAVPMLFRMGAGEREIRQRLSRGEDFRVPLCRASVGISRDEWRGAPAPGRRVYVFEPHAWEPAFVRDTLTRLEARP